jgi:hypothetical protein
MGKPSTKHQTNVHQKINLKDELGIDLSGRDDLKEMIGQAIIDKIKERTAAGADINGEAFKGYSKTYKESLEFKAAGKGNNVNMRLSGDMLELMDFSINGNTIKIGWDDVEQSKKAHGHITGGGFLPKRNFFGVTNDDLKDIKKDFLNALKDKVSDENKKFNAKILDLIKQVKNG